MYKITPSLVIGVLVGLVLGLLGTGTAVATGLVTSADITDGTIQPVDLSPETLALIDGATNSTVPRQPWVLSTDALPLSSTAVALVSGGATATTTDLGIPVKPGDRLTFSYSGDVVPVAVIKVSGVTLRSTEYNGVLNDDFTRTKTITIRRNGVIGFVQISRPASESGEATAVTNLAVNSRVIRFSV